MPCCVIRAYKLGSTTSIYCVIYITIPMTCYGITYVNLVSCVMEEVILINDLFILTCRNAMQLYQMSLGVSELQWKLF